MEWCPNNGKALLPSYMVKKGVDSTRGEELDCSCNLPQVPVMLLTSFYFNFPLGPLQTIFLPPHPQVTTPICLCSELQRRKETADLFLGLGLPAEDGRGKALSPRGWGWMWDLAQCCVGWGWTWDTQVQVYKSDSERPWLKAENICNLNTGAIISFVGLCKLICLLPFQFAIQFPWFHGWSEMEYSNPIDKAWSRKAKMAMELF